MVVINVPFEINNCLKLTIEEVLLSVILLVYYFKRLYIPSTSFH